MVQFKDIHRSKLAECIQAFLNDRVISILDSNRVSSENPEASSVAKQDSLEQRKKYFKFIYDQLFEFNKG